MTYDVVIVGAGSAGALLAHRLSEDPRRRVLVLEAGPDVARAADAPHALRDVWGPHAFPARSEHDWGLVARRARGDADTFSLPRGRVIGGTGAINAAIFLRALDDDFRRWAKLGLARWGDAEENRRALASLASDARTEPPRAVPLTFARDGELRAEQAAFLEACVARGHRRCERLDATDDDAVGALPLNLAAPDGGPPRVRWNPAWSFLDARTRGRPNLTIACDARAMRVVFDGRRAVGVDVAGARGAWRARGLEIVLAAGAIHSPLLLARSGVGDADALRALDVRVVAERRGVGKNLRDHPAAVFECGARRELRADLPCNQVALRATSPRSPHAGDVMIYPASRPHRGVIALRPTLNHAESAGEVRVGADGGADIAFDYLARGTDAERLAFAVRAAAELLATPPMSDALDAEPAARVAALSDRELHAWLRANVVTGHHPFGTCAMGAPRDPAAVVDDEGRVFGTERLRVVDASILPPFVRANINATVMTVAARIAGWIIG